MSSLSTQKTKINASAVDIDNSLIAGNWYAPDVSKISRVSRAPSGSS